MKYLIIILLLSSCYTRKQGETALHNVQIANKAAARTDSLYEHNKLKLQP